MALGRKTGGRVAGTPNKDNPLKGYLRTHSTAYFEPTIIVDSRLVDMYAALKKLCPYELGDKISQFDMDLALMDASERVDAEIKLLQYHTPKMQAVAADITVADDAATSLESRLAALTDDHQP